MKTKLLKNKEDILFYGWTVKHYTNTSSLFLFFSWTWCSTEVVSSQSNTYSCRSLSIDQCLFPALLFRLSIKSWLVKMFFFVKTLNFIFWPLFVWESSLSKIVEKGIISSKHFMSYQTKELFCRNLYVCKLILLHLMCTHSRQWSHWTAWWFFATALLQILHGNFTTISFQRELWNELSVR